MSELYELYVDGKQIQVTAESMTGTLREVIAKIELLDNYFNVVLWKVKK